MVKNSIKVFARLKGGKASKKSASLNYEILRRKDHENIVIQYDGGTERKQKQKFRFHKIFDKFSTQEELFDCIAKPVVNSVINGYNGTILAYGQTGSGKTYSITGSANNYNNRGIIPRSIQQIFEFINISPDKYCIHISYLEIYNEVGYDLLNPKQPATLLEDLPRVILLEDGKGEAHIRNLSIMPANSEKEAMRLLFLGDTNRTIAETPMNEYSSRSHCIFTVYLSSRSITTNKIRKCKLHLVDLAGSERIHKSNISGVTLNEAKHINLSLHYLEQVITALSQVKRQHIPYRNSMMTYMLRDSLSGNSMTVMLTTMCMTKENAEETISTSKFAQRVALINTEAVINEEIDPHEEINFLKNEIVDLQSQLECFKGLNASKKLSSTEKEECKCLVDKYLKDPSIKTLKIASKLPQVQFCFQLLREAYLAEKAKSVEEVDVNSGIDKEEDNTTKSTQCAKPKEEKHPRNQLDFGDSTEIQDREDFCNVDHLKPFRPKDLKQYCSKGCNVKDDAFLDDSSSISESGSSDTDSGAVMAKTSQESFIPEKLRSLDLLLPEEDRKPFQDYISDPNNRMEIESYYHMLDKKYECAKIVATTIEECQKNIIKIRGKMELLGGDARNFQEVNDLNCQLMFYQNIYRETIFQLQNLKNEIEHLKHGLRQAEIRTVRKFQSELGGKLSRSLSDVSIYDDGVFDILTKVDKENDSTVVNAKSLPNLSLPKQNELQKKICQNCCAGNVLKENLVQNTIGLGNFLELNGISQSTVAQNIESRNALPQQESQNGISRTTSINQNPWLSKNTCGEDISSYANSTLSPKTNQNPYNYTSLAAYKNQMCSQKNIYTNFYKYYGIKSDNLAPENETEKISVPSKKIFETTRSTIDQYLLKQNETLRQEFETRNPDVTLKELPKESKYRTLNIDNYNISNAVPVLNLGSSKASSMCNSTESKDATIVSSAGLNSLTSNDSRSTRREFYKPTGLKDFKFPNLNNVNDFDNGLKSDDSQPKTPQSPGNLVSDNMEPCKDHQDSKEFLEFMKTIPLTGDPDVDDEICNFYRSKFSSSNSEKS